MSIKKIQFFSHVDLGTGNLLLKKLFLNFGQKLFWFRHFRERNMALVLLFFGAIINEVAAKGFLNLKIKDFPKTFIFTFLWLMLLQLIHMVPANSWLVLWFPSCFCQQVSNYDIPSYWRISLKFKAVSSPPWKQFSPFEGNPLPVYLKVVFCNFFLPCTRPDPLVQQLVCPCLAVLLNPELAAESRFVVLEKTEKCGKQIDKA